MVFTQGLWMTSSTHPTEVQGCSTYSTGLYGLVASVLNLWCMGHFLLIVYLQLFNIMKVPWYLALWYGLSGYGVVELNIRYPMQISSKGKTPPLSCPLSDSRDTTQVVSPECCSGWVGVMETYWGRITVSTYTRFPQSPYTTLPNHAYFYDIHWNGDTMRGIYIVYRVFLPCFGAIDSW